MMLPFGAHCALAARCVALLVTSVLGSILCKGDELPHLLGQDVIPAVGPLGRDESEGRLIDKDAFRKMLHTHVAGTRCPTFHGCRAYLYCFHCPGDLTTHTEAVNSDKLNHEKSERVQELLQLVTDIHQRLALFDEVAQVFMEAGNREAAGLLGANLAEAMDRGKVPGLPDYLAIQEIFFRRSIEIFPESPFAARSLGYRLEQSGEELRAMQLYRELLAWSPERLDLKLLLASACSPFLESSGQGDLRFSRVSQEMQRLVNSIQMSDRIPHHQKVNSPGRDIVYIPSFSWQYMGRGMRPLMEALCWVLAAMTAGLHEVAPALHPSAGWDFEPRSSFGEEKHLHGGRRLSTDLSFVEEEDGSKKLNSTLTRKACTTAGTQEKIAVGVIMERRDNHSPHRLIHGVLKGLDRSRFRVLAFVRDYIGEYPLAGRAVIQSADEVVVLPWHTFATGTSDPFREREVIAASQVDVLLYMALGNTLGSHLLALGRLAPVQVAFGHGHPVTSGSHGIDYFVSSDLFETATSVDAREVRRFPGAGIDTLDANPDNYVAFAATTEPDVATNCNNKTIRSQKHHPPAETDATLTSARHHLAWSRVMQPSLLLSEGRHSQCLKQGYGDGTQDYTEQLVLFDSLTASLSDAQILPDHLRDDAALSAKDVAPGYGGLSHIKKGEHAYHCIQHSKKFHPAFDAVLRGVLLGDPAAKILLTAASKVHIARWNLTLGENLVSRLVFLPYLPHVEMLRVVAECRVMLDTFPWGAGVTSMEALSAGVPVVTLSAEISVLQLAAGQLRELGVENELVASDVDDMVRKAIKLASNYSYRRRISGLILERKDRLSDSRRAVQEWQRFFERALTSAAPHNVGPRLSRCV